MANFDDLFTAPTATETQSDRPQLTKEEYAAKKKAERDSLYALADEMAQEVMRDGEAFRGFLDVQARFDRYSATNALLIYAQNDEATRLRDFDGWKERGIYVRKNETGISILEAGDSYYALAAYYRFINGQTWLYDMSDVTIKANEQPVQPTDPTTPGTPATGDNQPVMLWFGSVLISGAAILLLAQKKKKVR